MKHPQPPLGKPRRGVVDKDYAAIKRATEARIQWPRIVSSHEWKWVENARSVSIYTKEGVSPSSGFSVFATGLIKGTMGEFAEVLQPSSQQDFEDQMLAFHGKPFKHGTWIPIMANDDPTEGVKETLSIRSATFAGPGWLRQRESWCFLDSTKRDDKQFERYMTALPLEDAQVGDKRREHKTDGVNCLTDVICAFRVQAQESLEGEPACVRLHFFAEMVPPSDSTSSSSGGRNRTNSDATLRAVHTHMLDLARSCERVSQIVRRQRLGLQELVEPRRTSPLTNPQCLNCDKSMMFAKFCRLCGDAVCKDCSDSYERETCRPHLRRGEVDKVRVCDPCLARVECAGNSKINSRPQAESAVFPISVAFKTVGGDINDLLQDALRRAPSPQREDATVHVMCCLLDPTRDSHHEQRRTKSSFRSTLSSSTASLDRDRINALDNLTMESVAVTNAQLPGQHGRYM